MGDKVMIIIGFLLVLYLVGMGIYKIVTRKVLNESYYDRYKEESIQIYARSSGVLDIILALLIAVEYFMIDKRFSGLLPAEFFYLAISGLMVVAAAKLYIWKFMLKDKRRF